MGLKFKGSMKDDLIVMVKMFFFEIVGELKWKKDYGRVELLFIVAYGYVVDGGVAAKEEDELCFCVCVVFVD